LRLAFEGLTKSSQVGLLEHPTNSALAGGQKPDLSEIGAATVRTEHPVGWSACEETFCGAELPPTNRRVGSAAAQPLRALLEWLPEPRLLRFAEPGLASGAARPPQTVRALAVESLGPLTDRLVADRQAAAHCGVVQTLAQQLSRFESPPLQSIKIAPYTFCVSQTGMDAG